MRHSRSLRKLSAAVMLLFGAVPTLAAQVAGAPVVPSRLEALRQVEVSFASSYPAPLEPTAPVAPKAPGIAPSGVVGLLLGAGAFVGTATLCGKQTVTGEAPYGSFVDGTYVAPGALLQVPAATACTAGSGAGAFLVGTWLTQSMRKGGYRRAVAAYETNAAQYPQQKAAYDRAVAMRQRAIDSAVTSVIADAERRAEAWRVAQQVAAAAAAAPAITPAAPVAVAEVPSVTAPKTGLVNADAVAVVIGNRRYARPEVPSVEYAGRDASAMKRFLIETFGFREENIIFEENASYASMQRIFGSERDFKGQLYNYMDPAAPSDVFFFYSGHGAPDPGTGTAYLVPTDADPQNIRLTGFSVSQLYANLAQLPARSITVVMDACFSGLTDRGALLRGISPLTLRIENPVLAAPNSVVLTASTSTEVSGWYDQQQHGLFTYVFLNNLATAFQNGVPAEVPSARSLAGRVTPEVVRLSRRLRSREQTPQLFGSGADAPLPFVRTAPR